MVLWSSKLEDKCGGCFHCQGDRRSLHEETRRSFSRDLMWEVIWNIVELGYELGVEAQLTTSSGLKLGYGCLKPPDKILK